MKFIQKLVPVEINIFDSIESILYSFGSFEFDFGVFIDVFQGGIDEVSGELELGPEVIKNGDNSERVFGGEFPDVLFELAERFFVA